MKKKLLYVITQGTWGGAQQYVYDLAYSYKDLYDLSVAIGEETGKKDLQYRLLKKNIKVIQLKKLIRTISPIKDILAILEIHKLIKTQIYDIIHINSTKAGIICSLATIGLKKKPLVIYTVHGWVFNEPISHIKKNIYQWLERLTKKRKHAFIILSPQDKKSGEKNIHIQKKKMHLIPIGISAQKILNKIEARKSLNISNDKFIIGTIANHYKTKGLDILLHAANILKKKKILFIIIGDGPEKKELLNIKEKLLLNNIKFVGYRENASQYLKAFDIFCLPSKKEGLPYTLLEAMNNKIPIIATKVGGIPSLIAHKKTGLLVEPNNPEMLAKEIQYALTHKENMQLYTKRLTLQKQNYTINNMITQTQSLYETLQ